VQLKRVSKRMTVTASNCWQRQLLSVHVLWCGKLSRTSEAKHYMPLSNQAVSGDAANLHSRSNGPIQSYGETSGQTSGQTLCCIACAYNLLFQSMAVELTVSQKSLHHSTTNRRFTTALIPFLLLLLLLLLFDSESTSMSAIQLQ
jgi:hypothetical protein